MTDLTTPPEGREKTFLGHPTQLGTLFGVEMWERFSFYGMQGILLYYMYFAVTEGGLGIDQGTAAGIVGAYGGTVYLSTIVAAWVADRMFGPERVLFGSALSVMAGHIALALVPGATGLAIGLVLVAFGSGGVKANASTILATLYGPGDDRRDAGFSIFYLGVNIGAFTGPLLTDGLRVVWGFHLGFGLAAIGMALGLVQYWFNRRKLPATGWVVPNPLPAAARSRVLVGAVLVLAAIAVLVATDVITADRLKWIVFGIVVVATISYFTLMLSSPRVERIERRRVLAFLPMWIASAVFWAIFQQIFTVLAIYSEERLDRSIFGIFEMPPAWSQSIEPVFVILLAGVYATVWTKLGPRQPSSPMKMAIGTVVVGLAFLLFVPFAGTGPNGTPLLALVVILLVFCLAELFTSPVGQSLSTKLAPQAFQTQMVALFFLSVSMGTVMSGLLAELYTADNEVAYFGITGVAAIVVGIVVMATVPKLKVLMEGVR
ncbi:MULTISPECIES: oligopeptide:H+ symporter [unclassified Pseudonocardia]|uniref:peptide MFS transporter n=2 Tax=unclassified Pseudonocardia TaxID=2619320 RepID=UPI0003160C3C|nr:MULTISPECIES: oligopeptide:H+ symporter [unclassified Pseudonocardia]ALE75697.1 major facilitator transporter [Pseudonocardia sp. EC080625-04]ALL75080.1 major facilitator transporter [Pseudonocardia sp. EC080610-09]ALL82102.1 major facilitator transporter [Pseudonocardia sp. EC080619-01]OLM21253.1 Di-/tripeptide transporter [Pseudonocardia sp. Ae707_Ps1]